MAFRMSYSSTDLYRLYDYLSSNIFVVYDHGLISITRFVIMKFRTTFRPTIFYLGFSYDLFVHGLYRSHDILSYNILSSTTETSTDLFDHTIRHHEISSDVSSLTFRRSRFFILAFRMTYSSTDYIDLTTS
ncbi:10105_t:CDS:1, partial [Funneliformis geosporum]